MQIYKSDKQDKCSYKFNSLAYHKFTTATFANKHFLLKSQKF